MDHRFNALFALLTMLLGLAFSADAQTSLPAPWSTRDIGSPAIEGSATAASGTFTIHAAGTDIWNTSDQFHFAYQTLTGDGEIVARVGSLTNTNGWAKAGVMIRESLAANARHAFAMVSAANGAALQYRASTGGASAHVAGTWNLPPRWVRLTRAGNTFTAAESIDGVTWRAIGTRSITMTASVYVGLAVTSHNTTRLTTATIANARVTLASANQPPSVSLTSPTANASYTAPATIMLQATASDNDGAISKVEFFSGSTLLGTATASPYSLTWSNVPAGIYSLTAVATDNLGAKVTSAARTVTVSGLSGSVPAPWTSEDVGAPAVSGTASESAGSFTIKAAGADIWGTGDQFHFVHQLLTGDGTIVARVQSLSPVNIWSKAGVMMRENLAAGSKHASMVVSSGAGLAFQRRAETNSTSSHTAGSNFDPDYWVKIVRRGDVFEAHESADGVTWRLVGSDTIAMLQTIHVGLAVTSHNVSTAATAVINGVALTGGGSTNQPPSVALTAPANGSTYTAPANVTLTATASDSDGSVARVDFYRSGTLIGSDTTAPYSAVWSGAPAGTYALTAVAVDNAGATATSAAAGVTVNGAANQPPSVALTAPANGSTYTAPANVTLTATASDSDGSVARVDFYRSGTLIGSDTTAPYSAVWSGAPAGTYALTAVAVDNAGATATSAAAGVTVNGAANQPPSVALTAPANGSTYTAPANVTLTATASDSDGSVARVDFYRSGTLIGSDTTAPYSAVWSGAPAGTYALTAVAVDNAGATATSAAAGITVNAAANQSPTVALTSPVTGSTFSAPTSVALVASAADADGTIARVDFYAGATLVASDTTNPYSVTWTNAAPGTYVLTAAAIDNAGARTTSASVSVTLRPALAVFAASPDHATTLVTSYRIEFFTSGANPSTATPLATLDVGKPTPVNGDVTADVTTAIRTLATGSYVVTAAAIGPGGVARSGAVTLTR